MGQKASLPVISVPCDEYPWQARRVDPDINVVNLYNFTNLLDESLVSEPATGELISLTATGHERWSMILAGNVEDFTLGDNNGGMQIPRLLAGTSIGTVVEGNAASGEV